ncbi:SRPBCC domain-containing protein [Mucilaginibacter limnophilus]|uniref:SRPBCC domain-containing protein n=1 Tax=Mucilaginibacter limnophilus TaxID=1932778 RepID=A0A437MU56_9SPHI|nr:SRPBCC family protein [Mucilaginibacter limnophilus]RVU01195.1 SRPBCC domain-containing protein [Mucilaginibacter limnophilus]
MEIQNNKKPTIEVAQDFNADATIVFQAWLDTNVIAKWMFGPEVRKESITKLENNPKIGGTFSYVVERNGNQLDHIGTYLEVQKNERLVFTWGIGQEAAKESIVSINLSPSTSGCHLILTHQMDPKWADYAERTKEGWKTILLNLAALFEKDNS